MSEIKTPVKVEGHAFCTDAEDKVLSVREVVAALNAAPKRAFETLPGELWAIYKAAASAAEERAGDPGGFGDSSEWDYYERVLVEELEKRLQAFAAPVAPAWQPIETAPMKGSVRILLFGPHAPGVCLGFWTDNPDVEWLADCDGMEGGSWPKDAFTHWQPLPAAPEAQEEQDDAPLYNKAKRLYEAAHRDDDSPYPAWMELTAAQRTQWIEVATKAAKLQSRGTALSSKGGAENAESNLYEAARKLYEGHRDACNSTKPDWGNLPADECQEWVRAVKLEGRCAAARDGECSWGLCPQKQNYQRWCPRARHDEDE